MKDNGYFERKRQEQARYWMYETIELNYVNTTTEVDALLRDNNEPKSLPTGRNGTSPQRQQGSRHYYFPQQKQPMKKILSTAAPRSNNPDPRGSRKTKST